MAEIRMPKLGFSMTEGTLVRWLIEPGSAVAEGEPLYAVETDKVEEEVGASHSGILRDPVEIGEVYEVGALLGHLDEAPGT